MPDNEVVRLSDIIGRIEAERILGVRPRTFSRMLAEGKLPIPERTLSDGTMLWKVQSIENYRDTRAK